MVHYRMFCLYGTRGKAVWLVLFYSAGLSPNFQPTQFSFRVAIFLLVTITYYPLVSSACNSYVFLWIIVHLLLYGNKFLLMLKFADRPIFWILRELIFAIMKDFFFKSRVQFCQLQLYEQFHDFTSGRRFQ